MVTNTILDALEGDFLPAVLSHKFAKIMHPLCNIKYKNKETFVFKYAEFVGPNEQSSLKQSKTEVIYLVQYCHYTKYLLRIFSFRIPFKTKCFTGNLALLLLDRHTLIKHIIITPQSHPPSYISPFISPAVALILTPQEFVWLE